MHTDLCTTSTSMQTYIRLAKRLALPSALALVTFAAATSVQAQSAVKVMAPKATYPSLNLSVPDSGESSNSSSSSASAFADSALAAERLSLSDTGQPPPRRRYGRPRYSDKSHNADGSNKYTYVLGVGFTNPTAGTRDYSKLNYKFQVGAGRNFNNKIGVIAQFDWDNFGIQTSTLNYLLAVYNRLGATDQNGNPINQIGGNTHAWSFSINPVVNLVQSEKIGVYTVVGVGFYHKSTNITTPIVATYYDPYYGYYQAAANSSIDKYTSNAPGFNGGLGLTYRTSRFSGVRLFVEGRYVYINNSQRPYYDGTTGTKLSPTYFNVFPQNSATTSYVPVTVGLRF
jgi:hypothetical protein